MRIAKWLHSRLPVRLRQICIAASERAAAQGLQTFRQLPTWALLGPALPPARTLFGSRPVWRPLLKVAYTRQGTIPCVGGLPRLA